MLIFRYLYGWHENSIIVADSLVNKNNKFNKMRMFVSLLVSVLFSVATVYGQKLETKDFNVRDYDKIVVQNAIDVKLIPDGREGVSVRCDSRLLPAVYVLSRGNKLKIGLDWELLQEITGSRRNRTVSFSKERIEINGMVFKGGIKIIAHIKHIRELEASSAADIHWDANLSTDELDIKCSSSGDIYWTGLLLVDNLDIECSSSAGVKGNIKAKEVEIDLSSSADYKGNVEAQTIKVELSSSADFNGQLIAENAKFNISSSADFIGKVDANTASFYMSSSANARVKGIINSLFVKATSSSDFKGRGIVYKKAEVKTLSNGDIYLSKSGKVIDNTPRRTGVFVE